MVPLYDLSTTNFSCKVAIGPLNPHQGAALDPIFQIFPRLWSFLVGSTGFFIFFYKIKKNQQPCWSRRF